MNTNLQTYDKLVRTSSEGKIRRKKLFAVIGYAFFFSVWLLFALNTPDLIVPIIVAGGLCTFALMMLTWKYFDVEYEYSIWYGTFTLAKIYAKKKRKNLLSADVKEFLLIAPATEEYVNKANHFEPKQTFYAISSKQAEDVWIFVTGGKDEPRNLVFFEADERSLNMLRSANPSVFVKNRNK
ncbi:MAG: hypothetical protein J6M35_05070 [Clostridia bacterium]|nr:hypothetical protein [Clostridia bacterium]